MEENVAVLSELMEPAGSAPEVSDSLEKLGLLSGFGKQPGGARRGQKSGRRC